MEHLCGTRLPPDYKNKRALQSSIVDPEEYLYIPVKYIVIYNNEEQNVSLTRIEAQNKVINEDFNKSNADINRVPSAGHYNFASVIGDGKIRFVLEGEVVRLSTSKTFFDGLEEAEDFVQSHNGVFKEGCLNVYICALRSGLLGQAGLFSNSAVINYKTVGSPSQLGDPLLVDYNMGRTLSHEIGHVFGLPHTFSGTCDESNDEFPDIPAQLYPNFDATLVKDSQGTYDGTLDNHFRDCNGSSYNVPGRPGPYSCSNDCNLNYEMFFNFMDYGNDKNAICFSQSQIHEMRKYLLGTNNITLKEGSQQPDEIVGENVPEVESIGTLSDDATKENKSLSTGGAVGLTFGIIILLVIIFLIIFYAMKS